MPILDVTAKLWDFGEVVTAKPETPPPSYILDVHIHMYISIYRYIYIYIIYMYMYIYVCMIMYEDETLIRLDQQAGGKIKKELDRGGMRAPPTRARPIRA